MYLNIYYYTDQIFENSHWYKRCYQGMASVVSRKKYTLKRLSSCEPDSVLASISEKNNPLLLIGTTQYKLASVTEAFSSSQIRVIAVNYMPEYSMSGVSSVIMDYRAGVRLSMAYLRSAANQIGLPKKRIALFGVNPASFTDKEKQEAFYACGGLNEDVFFNTDGLHPLCQTFIRQTQLYNAVICTCDITALALREALNGRAAVPDKMLMITFGDMDDGQGENMLSRLELATITVSHNTLGQQSVLLARYLSRIDEPVSITVRIAPSIHPARSTRNCPLPTPVSQTMRFKSENTFFEDPMVAEINAFERCMYKMTNEDLRIVQMLMWNMNRALIAEQMQISESTLYERIRGMCRDAGVGNTQQLVALMGKYL